MRVNLIIESVLAISIGVIIRTCRASVGDRSPYFRHCVKDCVEDNCSNEEKLARFLRDQSLINRLAWWDCESECQHVCMWMTMEQFEKQNDPVPQFYGKWPFHRWAGMQEPASTIFSVLNLLANVYMLVTIVRRMPKDAPLRRLWISYAIIAIFAWFWSSVFHTRDFPWTEKMDYFCAFAAVMFGFYASLVRVHGTDPIWRIGLVGAALAGYFVWHVYYLGFVRFDYGYNMKANVTIGLSNSISWTLWCAYQYFWRGETYVWRCALVIISALSLLSLELYDFAPIWWTFDAHSLWHLGTIPLPFLWTRFALDDCENLLKEQKINQLRKTKKRRKAMDDHKNRFLASIKQSIKSIYDRYPYASPFLIAWVLLSVVPAALFALFVGVLIAVSTFLCLIWIGFWLAVALFMLVSVLLITAFVSAWIAAAILVVNYFVYPTSLSSKNRRHSEKFESKFALSQFTPASKLYEQMMTSNRERTSMDSSSSSKSHAE